MRAALDLANESIFAFLVFFAIFRISLVAGLVEVDLAKNPAIHRGQPKALDFFQMPLVAGEHHRPAAMTPGQIEFGVSHTTAPAPYVRRGVFGFRDHKSKRTVGQFPVRPCRDIAQRKCGPLRECVSCAFRHRDHLAVSQNHLLRQAAHRARCIVGHDLDRIAPTVFDPGAKNDRVLARFDVLDLRPDLENLDYSGIANDNFRLIALHTDIHRLSIEGVTHVAFPGSVQRPGPDAVFADRGKFKQFAHQFRSYRFSAVAGVENPGINFPTHVTLPNLYSLAGAAGRGCI